MSKNTNNKEIDGKTEDLSYIPSSAIKRTMAWIGLVYMVIIVALTTYLYSTASTLNNLAPILTIPALVGAGVLILVSHKTEGRPSKVVAMVGAALCFILAIITAPIGLVGLMSNFGG